MQDPIETKIHPRLAADAKFESSRGVIIDQLSMCRVRGNPGTQTDSSAAGQRLGKTREGNPDGRQAAQPGGL